MTTHFQRQEYSMQYLQRRLTRMSRLGFWAVCGYYGAWFLAGLVLELVHELS